MTKKLIALVVLVVAMATVVGAQQQLVTGTITRGTTCASDGACVVADVNKDSGGAAIQLTGTFVATVSFEVTTDGGTWTSIIGTPIGGGAAVSTATAGGLWQFNSAGVSKIRARASAYTSGSISVSILPTPGSIGNGGTVTVSGTVNVDPVANTIGLSTGAKQDTGNTSVANIYTSQGTPADASATAGSTGTEQAKFRLMTTQLDAIKTAVESLAPVAVTIASGGVASGAIASGAYASGSIGSGAVASGAVASGAIAAGAYSTGSLNSAIPDPCFYTAKTPVPINFASSSVQTIIASSSSNKVYICQMLLFSATAQNIAIAEDATAACASLDAGIIGGVTTGAGLNLVANQGVQMGNGLGTIAKSTSANVNFCMLSSSTGQVTGNLMYVLAP